MRDIIDLRHHLHSIAEPSGNEVETNKCINAFLKTLNPDLIIERIGGYGVAAVFRGRRKGRRVLVRGDIDALLIEEPNAIPYRSKNKGVSHKCGHDGHTAILCGLAQRLSANRPERGEVVLLFQPAEETGQGAQAVIRDPAFAQIAPNAAYGLHNIPGVEKDTILVSDGCFAAASFGLKLVFDGKTAHASQPETGRNPSDLLAVVMHNLEKKRDLLRDVRPLTTFVITHAILGEESFGIAPGHAEVWLTLRSFSDKNLEILAQQIIQMAQGLADDRLFDFKFTMHEAFQATVCNREKTEIIAKSADWLNLVVVKMDEPFRWSEDFGRFGSVCPIGFFGLGSGMEQPALHNSDFDFPDDIIETGIHMFEGIIEAEL